MKVLIAERDSKAVDDIKIAFNLFELNCELIATESGRECISKARENSLDIILLALDLADISGLDVLREIRGFSNTDTDIIALSSKYDAAGAVKALNLGADQCVAKPLNQSELIARIRAVLRRRDRRLRKGRS